MNTSSKGSQTEAVILAALVKQGYTVFIPFGGHHHIDLIVDNGSQLIKAQCKTGWIRNGALRFSTSTVVKDWTNRKVTSRGYEDHEVDVFLVWCPEVDQIWSIPKEIASKGRMQLRIDPPKNNQSKGVKMADQFEGLSDLGANGSISDCHSEDTSSNLVGRID